MEDILSQALREMRFASAGYRRLELGTPFGIAFTQAGLRGVHIVLSGACELVLGDGHVEEIDAGDLVILPRADPHVLRSRGAGPAQTVSSAQLAAQSNTRLHAGGPGAPTAILCGAFVVGEPDHPALRGLPPVVHVRGADGAVVPWLRPYIDAVTAEVSDGGAGSDLVMARLSDALVIRSLRHHSDTVDEPGWLAALRDPCLAPALHALHTDLARPWTVASLARIAGQSRATFAARFTDRVGEPVIGYLLALRMQRARTLLRDERLTIAAIANRVGYQSDVAFATAFKREHRITPGAYRSGVSIDRSAGY